MKSIIICEGSTDLVLIQHFMQVANNWEYKLKQKSTPQPLGCEKYKKLTKGSSELEIIDVDGCGNISAYLDKSIDRNVNTQSDDELYNNIIIISDRDEIDTMTGFESKIKTCLSDFNVTYLDNLENDKWIICRANTWRSNITFRILMLIIPFENTGALETFLLQAVAENDAYDAKIISNCNEFVDNIDPEKRYLGKRRHITKAKFDVYFSVRTPLEQFSQRHNILKGVDWTKYEKIQQCFIKLQEL